MSEQRLIDANKEVIRAYEDIPEPYSDVLISFLRGCETIDPESLPIVQQLRETLSKAVAEKEAAEALLAEYGGVDFCKTIKTCFGYPLDKVQQLVEADKSGRCVVLPCKRGDTLWTFCNYPIQKVYSFNVTDLSTLNGRTMLNTDVLSVVDARDVGKTVFLTREAAEAALAKEANQ